MSNIKVIISDIDRTLLTTDAIITERTKKVLQEAQQQGIRLVLASGRSTNAMQSFARELHMHEHHGLLCSYNGSRVIDCQTNEILFNEPISAELSKAVLEHLKKFDLKIIFDKDDYMYVDDVYNGVISYNGTDLDIYKYESRGGNFLLCEKPDLAAFVDFEINKILTAANEEYLQKHYEEMSEPFKGLLNYMFTAPFYFEFTSFGIDKAKSLNTVLSYLGYNSEETIAFGDGHNDISMIKYAGIGVAMENAVDELKAVADKITLSNDKDGIVYMLNQIL